MIKVGDCRSKTTVEPRRLKSRTYPTSVCVEMDIKTISAIVVSALAILLDIVGLAIPYWTFVGNSDANTRWGLWKICGTLGSRSTCATISNPSRWLCSFSSSSVSFCPVTDLWGCDLYIYQLHHSSHLLHNFSFLSLSKETYLYKRSKAIKSNICHNILG